MIGKEVTFRNDPENEPLRMGVGIVQREYTIDNEKYYTLKWAGQDSYLRDDNGKMIKYHSSQLIDNNDDVMSVIMSDLENQRKSIPVDNPKYFEIKHLLIMMKIRQDGGIIEAITSAGKEPNFPKCFFDRYIDHPKDTEGIEYIQSIINEWTEN